MVYNIIVEIKLMNIKVIRFMWYFKNHNLIVVLDLEVVMTCIIFVMTFWNI